MANELLDEVVVSKKIVIDNNGSNVVVEEKNIICSVCGHSNNITSSQCAMCGNYLEVKERNV